MPPMSERRYSQVGWSFSIALHGAIWLFWAFLGVTPPVIEEKKISLPLGMILSQEPSPPLPAPTPAPPPAVPLESSEPLEIPKPSLKNPAPHPKPLVKNRDKMAIEPKVTPLMSQERESISTDSLLSPAPLAVMEGVRETKEVEEEAYLFEQIRQIIQKNRSYPERARRRNIEGEVVVEFLFTARGEVRNLTLVQSSGSSTLDDYSLRLIEESKEQFPRPKESIKVKLPIGYRLL